MIHFLVSDLSGLNKKTYFQTISFSELAQSSILHACISYLNSVCDLELNFWSTQLWLLWFALKRIDNCATRRSIDGTIWLFRPCRCVLQLYYKRGKPWTPILPEIHLGMGNPLHPLIPLSQISTYSSLVDAVPPLQIPTHSSLIDTVSPSQISTHSSQVDGVAYGPLVSNMIRVPQPLFTPRSKWHLSLGRSNPLANPIAFEYSNAGSQKGVRMVDLATKDCSFLIKGATDKVFATTGSTKITLRILVSTLS